MPDNEFIKKYLQCFKSYNINISTQTVVCSLDSVILNNDIETEIPKITPVKRTEYKGNTPIDTSHFHQYQLNNSFTSFSLFLKGIKKRLREISPLPDQVRGGVIFTRLS